MLELSLNILDIVQNSIRANASIVYINLILTGDILSVEIIDDGDGMDNQMLIDVQNPFVTSRTTRKVGLGIPLFKQGALLTGGDFSLESTLNVGTTIKASFVTSNIDYIPLGEIWETVGALIQLNPSVEFVYKASNSQDEFVCDTRQLKEFLETDNLQNLEVIIWIKDFIKENGQEIFNGRMI